MKLGFVMAVGRSFVLAAKRGFSMAACLLLTASLAGQTQPKAAALWTISGTVVSAEGGPLSQADVTLSTTGADASLVTEALTREDGTFRFPSLPAGKYALEASHRGYIAAGYQQHENFFTAVVTGPGLDTENLRLELQPWAVIDGAVTDDNGDPVPGAQVSLWSRNRSTGVQRIVREKQQNTDASGTYEFSGLHPGTYYLSVTATPWYAFHPPPQYDSQGNRLPPNQQTDSPLDVVYPLTFYQNATDSAAATPVDVHPGDRLQLNISLHAVPAVHVQVRIPVSGDPRRGIRMPQIVANVFGSDEYVRSVENGGAIRNGFLDAEIEGLAPGDYTLRISGPDAAETSMPVNLTSDSSVNLPAASSSGVSITGKVAMADGAPLPDHLSVNLRLSDGRYSGTPANVAADGSFSFPSVNPGAYELNAFAPNGFFPIVEMAASGAAVAGETLTVAGDPVLLAATMATESATVSGFARRYGKGVGGAMVVLVPANPHASEQRYRLDQSDSDGSFTLQRVIAGSYILVAIEDGWSLDWADRAAMAPYLAHGSKIQIAVDQKNIELPGSIEVQNR